MAEKAAAHEKHLACHVRKQFEETKEQGCNIQGRILGVPIMTDRAIGRSIRFHRTNFSLFVGEKDIVKIILARRSLLRREGSLLPIGASSSGTHCTPSLPATEAFAENTCPKEVLKIIENKQTTRAASSDVHRTFDDTLDWFTVADNRQIFEEVWIHPVDKAWSKTLWIPPCFPKIAEPEIHNHVSPFLHTARNPLDHRANVFPF